MKILQYLVTLGSALFLFLILFFMITIMNITSDTSILRNVPIGQTPQNFISTDIPRYYNMAGRFSNMGPFPLTNAYQLNQFYNQKASQFFSRSPEQCGGNKMMCFVGSTLQSMPSMSKGATMGNLLLDYQDMEMNDYEAKPNIDMGFKFAIDNPYTTTDDVYNLGNPPTDTFQLRKELDKQEIPEGQKKAMMHLARRRKRIAREPCDLDEIYHQHLDLIENLWKQPATAGNMSHHSQQYDNWLKNNNTNGGGENAPSYAAKNTLLNPIYCNNLYAGFRPFGGLGRLSSIH